MHYIYALVDPVTKEMKYVGQTNWSSRRLAEHRMIYGYSKKINKLDDSSSLYDWLHYVVETLNKKISMVILQKIDNKDDADYAEGWWIKTLIEKGNKLYNKANLKTYMNGGVPQKHTTVRRKDLLIRITKLGISQETGVLLLGFSNVDEFNPDELASHSLKLKTNCLEQCVHFHKNLDAAIRAYKQYYRKQFHLPVTADDDRRGG